MSNEAYRQVYDPYQEHDIPMFITSDSLLHAFHVLYEESVLRMETAHARRLPEILRFIWKNLETVDKDVKDKLEGYLKQEKVQEEIKLYVEKLKEKAKVEKFPMEDSS